MWFDILKEEEETPHRMWPQPKEQFEKNSKRALGYVMSYWYLKNKEEIEAWVESQSNLEGIFIDVGNRAKGYRFGLGGYFIFDRSKIQQAISENTELLQKHNIPTDVDGLVNNIATTQYSVHSYDEDIYNFIADLFGDPRRRKDNPLSAHKRIENMKRHEARQRGFE